MNRKHTADTLFVVLLYGLFALLSLLLILIGARVYKRTVEHTEARGDVRASLSYVANKVRAADRVSLETRDGLSVLVLDRRGTQCEKWDALPQKFGEDGLLAITSAGRDGQPHTLHIALCRE